MQSLRRRVWATRFFENSVPDAFDAHFFNGLLMLARGEGPILIDQPEDELDSSFIYRTLVCDLRAAKSKRQLIVATHNANLPVNADAEQIYALEARDGRGRVRAQGGLDRKGVAEAVLDIMEGSEQAFKQRSEKYHF